MGWVASISGSLVACHINLIENCNKTTNEYNHKSNRQNYFLFTHLLFQIDGDFVFAKALIFHFLNFAQLQKMYSNMSYNQQLVPLAGFLNTLSFVCWVSWESAWVLFHTCAQFDKQCLPKVIVTSWASNFVAIEKYIILIKYSKK